MGRDVWRREEDQSGNSKRVEKKSKRNHQAMPTITTPKDCQLRRMAHPPPKSLIKNRGAEEEGCEEKEKKNN
eukprot:1156138-Pelagomonas_calceolata.AAC.22